jgi:hypothetical protein
LKEEDATQLRKYLLELWRREHVIAWDEWRKARPKFNVSLSRSILSLRRKGLVRAFKLDTPDTAVWMLANLLQVTRFTSPLFLSEEQKAERQSYTRAYENAKQAKRERRFNYVEIKDGDYMQAVGLTEAGKQLALTLTSSNAGKLTISQQSTPQPEPLELPIEVAPHA